MANPTTNFGWVMPTSASLVTNLPADFNTFGQAVDTSMAQLKGGTTGQILSKTSATDMAFTWITNDVGDITAVTAGTGISGGGTSGAVTVTNSMATAITTAGDLIKGTGSGTFDRLGIGSTGQVLTVAAGAPSWATPASGSASFVGASIRNESGISVDSSTTTTMPFPQETFDTSGFHDNTTNNSRFTVPSGKAGYYQINYTVLYQGYSSSHAVRLVYFLNGTQICLYKDACVAGVGEQNYFFSRTLNLAVGDYIELKVWQDSGTARSFYVDGNQGQAVMTYLGA
jgi:hypothetical protein